MQAAAAGDVDWPSAAIEAVLIAPGVEGDNGGAEGDVRIGIVDAIPEAARIDVDDKIGGVEPVADIAPGLHVTARGCRRQRLGIRRIPTPPPRPLAAVARFQ